MRHQARPRRRERGATLLLITFIATFVLIPMMGLAIDGAMLFWTKARLSAAIDAAALASGRSLNVGDTPAAQAANAQLIAKQYFAANFPTGTGPRAIQIGSGDPVVRVNSLANSRTVTVSVSTIAVPLFFMPILRINTGTLAATGTVSRRDANIVLVLDRSGSMNNANNSCSALISAAQTNFINKFANGRDRLALVTFSTTASVDFPPSLTFNTDSPNIGQVLSSLVCFGATSTAEGLFTAEQLLKTINEPGALNVILLFTDGSPSSVFVDVPLKIWSDTRYGTGIGLLGSYPASSAVFTPASSCPVTYLNGNAMALSGIVADTTLDVAPSVSLLQTTGQTSGVWSNNPVSLSAAEATPPLAGASPCSFFSYVQSMRLDVGYLPATDHNGDPLDGPIYPLDPSVDRFPADTPYEGGQIRPDIPRTLRWIAFNAADARAQTIRAQDGITIYTIGLAGNEPMAMDQTFMQRLANDPQLVNNPDPRAQGFFDPGKPQGLFKLATDRAGMAQAFAAVASEVLHLTN